MVKGTVKFFNESKGYGFIVSDDDSRDYFVHAKAINTPKRELKEGDRVEFELVPSSKGSGKMASNVSLLR